MIDAPKPRRLPRFSLRSLILLVALAGSAYGLWVRWEPWHPVSSWTCQEPGYHGVKLSPDSKSMIVYSHEARTVTLIDLASNAQIFHQQYQTSMSHAYSPDGKQFYIHEDYKELVTRRTADGSVVRRKPLLRDPESRRSYLLRRNSVLFCQVVANETYRIQYPLDDDRTIELQSGSGPFLGCRVSQSGRWAATFNLDKTILLWDLRADKSNSSRLVSEGVHSWARFSPDEKYVATWPQVLSPRHQDLIKEVEEFIYVWKTQTGELIAKIPWEASKLETVAFLDQSKILAVPSFDDRVVHFWSLAEPPSKKSHTFTWPALNQDLADNNAFVVDEVDSINFYQLSDLKLLHRLPLLNGGNQGLADGDMDAGVLVTTSFPVGPDGERRYDDGIWTSQVYRRRRPESWWGVAWLPEFWLTLTLGVGLLWSVRRDMRSLKPVA